jgi:haloacetate dehalogenase
MLGSWAGPRGFFTDDAMAEYVRCFSDPEVIHASCEDYRAGAFVDCQLDEADLAAGRKIGCPVLALWGDQGRPHKRRQVMETWRRWATDVRGEGLPCGHFLAEEAPEETCAALERFFA